MTGNERPGHGLRPAGTDSGVPVGPPWAFDDLADLHAGLLADDLAARVRRAIDADTEAQLMLAALDATCDDLRALPPIPMPASVAARLDAALAAESARRSELGPAHDGPAPARRTGAADPSGAAGPGPDDGAAAGAAVRSLAAARHKRRQRLGWGAGVLAAAAAAIGLAIAAPTGLGGQDGSPQAAPDSPPAFDTPPATTAPLALTSATLASAISQVHSSTDYGPLRSAGRLDACLAAAGVPQTGPPLGVRHVTLRDSPDSAGADGVLVVLPGGALGAFRLVVVGANCGPGNPQKLADTTIPGG